MVFLLGLLVFYRELLTVSEITHLIKFIKIKGFSSLFKDEETRGTTLIRIIKCLIMITV